MRTPHALAASGGPGREQDVGDVVRGDGGRAGVDCLEVCPAGDELVPRPVVLLDRDADDVAERGQRVTVDACGLVGSEEVAGREQQRSCGAAEDVCCLAGCVAGVQWNEHAAGVVRRQARHHPVPGVRRPDGDAITWFDAKVDHRRGGLPDLRAQVGERQCSRCGRIAGSAGGRHDCGVVGELARDPVENRGSGSQL